MSSNITPEATTRDRDKWCYKMKDLCQATGLERQAIHFYIQQGLLQPGFKTGRNMAWYAEEHIERLQLIRKLQRERFLPLKAIKALLDGREDDFTPEQQQFLTRVKDRMEAEAPLEAIPLDTLCERTGVDPQDVTEAIDLGVLAVTTVDGEKVVAENQAWMLELFGQMRSLGFSRELGFTVADVVFYEETMNNLFREEVQLITRRLTSLPPERAAEMIERALPIIHVFLTRYHMRRVKDFFGSL